MITKTAANTFKTIVIYTYTRTHTHAHTHTHTHTHTYIYIYQSNELNNKHITIVIYDHNDSGQYCKTIYIDNCQCLQRNLLHCFQKKVFFHRMKSFWWKLPFWWEFWSEQQLLQTCSDILEDDTWQNDTKHKEQVSA